MSDFYFLPVEQMNMVEDIEKHRYNDRLCCSMIQIVYKVIKHNNYNTVFCILLHSFYISIAI